MVRELEGDPDMLVVILAPACKVAAHNRDTASVAFEEPDQYTLRGRLARPSRSQEAEDLARLDPEAHVVHRGMCRPGVCIRQIAYTNCCPVPGHFGGLFQ